MSKANQAKPEHDQFDDIQESLSKTEQLLERYQKQILIGIVSLFVLVGGYFLLLSFYFQPLEVKAHEAMFKAESYFQQDSIQKALNGDGINLGFKAIADEYSSTVAGNLAKAYAGACLAEQGNYEEAIKYLNSFSAGDKQIQPAVLSLVGDCYVNMDKYADAISYFEKAASKADESYLSTQFLKKAGLAYEAQGKYKEAIVVYEKIRDQYYQAQEANDIEKYIIRASANLK